MQFCHSFIHAKDDWKKICRVRFTSTPPQPTYAVFPRSNPLQTSTIRPLQPTGDQKDLRFQRLSG